MTAILRLALRGSGPEGKQAILPCDVIDTRGPLVRELSLNTGRPLELSMEPGTYAVRVPLPGGTRFERHVTIVADDRLVEIMVELPSVLYGSRLRSYASDDDADSPVSHQADSPMTSWSPWACLWSTDGPVEWQPTYVENLHSELRFGLYGLEQIYDLQIGGGRGPWRIVALPRANEVHVAFQYDPSDPRPTAIAVSVQGESAAAAAIMTYLATGRTDLAERVANVASPAQGSSSVEAENLAVALCYLGLRTNNYELLEEGWRSRPVRQSLPDWDTLGAWRIVASSRVDGGAVTEEVAEGARAHLLRACAKQLPRYTEGLRLLRLGLEMLFPAKHGSPTVTDPGLAQSLARLGEVARVCDWNQPSTTFVGSGPGAALKTLHFGLPPHAVYLFPSLSATHVSNPFLPVVPVESATPDIGLAARDDRVGRHRPRHRWRLISKSGAAVVISVRSFHSDAALEVRAEPGCRVVTADGVRVEHKWIALDARRDDSIGHVLRSQLAIEEDIPARRKDILPPPSSSGS